MYNLSIPSQCKGFLKDFYDKVKTSHGTVYPVLDGER